MLITQKIQEALVRAGVNKEVIEVASYEGYDNIAYGIVIKEDDYLVTISCYSEDEVDIMISKQVNIDFDRIAAILNEWNGTYRGANFFFDQGYVTLRVSCNRIGGNSKIILTEMENCLKIAVKEIGHIFTRNSQFQM